MRMKIRKKGLFSCLTVCLMGAAICLGSFRIREFQVEKREAFLSRERAVSAESAAGANEGDNSIAWKKAWQEGKYVNEAMKSYSLNNDYISKETFLEQYREHGLGDFLYTYPQWNIIFQDGFWQPDTEWSWKKKNQAKAFTNLIWREEWSQQAETYSLYYDAGGQLQQLQIHYADGKAKRYAYDTSMREVYHEEGQFWEKEEIGLIQLTEETKPDEKEKNVYRQPAAEVFKALYLPVLEEEKGETPLFIGSQGKYLITEAEQLKTLSHLISEEEEIEPGIRADEASYYLCSDLTIEDWVQIGGVLTPFKGQFYGNGHTVTGFGFSISDDTLGSYEKVFDLNRESPLIPQEEMTVIPRKELEAVFGQEGEQLLEQLLDKEGNVLEQTQVKVLENKMVSCVLSLTGNREDEIHLLLKSEGEGEEFFQHCVFEANDLVMPDYVCYLSEADINYDGNEDILLYQGHTGGTSRGYGVFYAMVWNEAEQRYEEFPSFPPMCSVLNSMNRGLLIRLKSE